MCPKNSGEDQKMGKRIFSFDVGTSSLGITVREGYEILYSASLLLPEDFASTKDQRSRRRQYRTRLAHKMREKWLNQECDKAGIEVLHGRIPGDRKNNVPPHPGDYRLEQEFPKTDENTVYTSCLLRIMLLQGKQLEGWQIYKALHSAIQRRGYDDCLPWRNQKDIRNDEDEITNKAKTGEYITALAKIVNNDDQYMYPCYYDAYQMGLWNPETNSIKQNIDNTASRARGRITPRELVEKELRALLEKAALTYPKLKDRIDYILYGPAGIPYASFYPEIRKELNIKEGSVDDWQGVLSQKIPRFDNRIVDKCALIPRFNVCRSSDHLVMQVTFLMKLISIRYRNDAYEEFGMTPDDIRNIFSEKKQDADEVRRKLKKSGASETVINEETAKVYHFNVSPWKNWLNKHKNGIPIPNHEKIESPSFTGRSRFCRPALKILRDLILSGENPWDYHRTLLTDLENQKKRTLEPEDISFLLSMPNDWEKIHIPQISLADRYLQNTEDNEVGIRKVIASQKDPVVRHRLEIFHRYLSELSEQYGVPDRVVIEFVREDFLSPKRKARLISIQRENRKSREEAKSKADELGASSKDSVLKLQLLKQQNYRCLYTGENLSENEISMYEIDHVVPRHGKYEGSDSILNKVITKSSTNREKADRTPHEYLISGEGWSSYCKRVKGCAKQLGWKKVRLLTAEHPEEVDDKYMSLAETAWIARTARDVVCLTFGWQPGAPGEKQKISIVSGGLTAKIRRKYRIDSLLAGENSTDPDEIMKKNRDDKRHHALDAMVLSFVDGKNPLLPDTINREFFRPYIEKVVPRYIANEKPALEETIYGKRLIRENGKDKNVYVKRESVFDLAVDNGKFNAVKARKKAANILDASIRDQVNAFLDTNPDKQAWEDFCRSLRQSPIGGALVRKTAMKISEEPEYKDLSKDTGRGQYRKGTKSWGQFVYEDQRGRINIRQVYAFESLGKVKREITAVGFTIRGFFTAGCLVEIQRDFEYNGRFIPAGQYILGSLWSNGQVNIKSNIDALKNPVHIKNLLAAGFRRVR